MIKVFLFNIKLLRKNYLVIFATLVYFLMVLSMVWVVENRPSESPPPLVQGTIGVYTGVPFPISFKGIKLYTSTVSMVEDIKDMKLPIGVDVRNKVLYTAPIYASISTEALSYMASTAERLFKGGRLYSYIDDVWWDPYTVSAKDLGYAVVVFILFMSDFLIMYLALAAKAKLDSVEKLWHLLGISKLQLQLAFILFSLLSPFIIIVPMLVAHPTVIKLLPSILLITLISGGIAAYFLRSATNMLSAYLSLIPPIALFLGSFTYVLLPDSFGIFKYIPWTITLIDVFKYAGAEGMIGGITPALRWIVYIVWSLIAVWGWYKGVIEDA